MSTQTELIAAAVVSALTGAGLTARMTTDAVYSFETMPMVLVDVGAEAPVGRFGQLTVGPVYWKLEVTLVIAAESATAPRLAPETTRKTAHAALYADRTLGGLAQDVQADQVRREINEENPAAGIAWCSYYIQYRVAENTL